MLKTTTRRPTAHTPFSGRALRRREEYTTARTLIEERDRLLAENAVLRTRIAALESSLRRAYARMVA
jgi:hypothetical protein